MQIRPLDASEPAAMAAWHATYHAAHVFGQQHASPWMLEEMRASSSASGRRADRALRRVRRRGLRRDRHPRLPQMDNRHIGYLDVAVHPDHRRQGHGSAMLATSPSRGRPGPEHPQRRRRVGPRRAADGAGTTNADFLTAHGFVFGLGDVKRALDLPVDDALLERLAAEAAPHHVDYVLRDFVGPVPEDIIDAFGDLVGSLISEAPMGDLDFEPEVFDATRIRADEKVFEASGRTKYTTVAIAGDGEVVAYSELVVPTYDPGGSTSGGPSSDRLTGAIGWAWPPRCTTCAGCRSRSPAARWCSPTTPRSTTT